MQYDQARAKMKTRYLNRIADLEKAIQEFEVIIVEFKRLLKENVSKEEPEINPAWIAYLEKGGTFAGGVDK